MGSIFTKLQRRHLVRCSRKDRLTKCRGGHLLTGVCRLPPRIPIPPGAGFDFPGTPFLSHMPYEEFTTNKELLCTCCEGINMNKNKVLVPAASQKSIGVDPAHGVLSVEIKKPHCWGS